MRLFACLSSILILLLFGGAWLNYSLQESSQDLGRQIEKLSQEVRREEWETAQRHSHTLEKSLEEKTRWWPIILNHQEIDNIEFSLAKVKEYVVNRDLPLALGQLSELKLMIEHIPRKEAVNLENIL